MCKPRVLSFPVQAACSLTRVCWRSAIAGEAATNHTERKENSQPQHLELSPALSSARCWKFLIWIQRPGVSIVWNRAGCCPPDRHSESDPLPTPLRSEPQQCHCPAWQPLGSPVPHFHKWPCSSCAGRSVSLGQGGPTLLP